MRYCSRRALPVCRRRDLPVSMQLGRRDLPVSMWFVSGQGCPSYSRGIGTRMSLLRQAVKKTPLLHVGLGPSDATRASERVSLAVHRSGKRRWLACVFRAGRAIAGDRPPRYGEKNVPFPVGRGPVPRHAPVVKANVRGLWSSDVFRFGRAIAGDRPPRYEKVGFPQSYGESNSSNCDSVVFTCALPSTF